MGMPQSPLPFVSVIIPVFNDAIALERCLEALQQQTYPRDRYEIIVVDNGSLPDQNPVNIVQAFPQATLAQEQQPGSYAARNKGIATASGTVLAFTDADCIPACAWLENGVKTLLAHPHCGFVAGKIETTFQDQHHPTAIELYESLWYALPQQEFVEKQHFGATANIFTFASVMQQVGVFDGSLKSNGDREWGQRVHAAGYQPIYSESASISHPARRSLPQLYARARRIAGGRHDLQQKQPYLERNRVFIFNLLKYLIAPFPMVGFNLFLDKRLKTVDQKIKVSLVMMFVSYVYVWEMLRLKCGSTAYRG